jgi:hypothetical protein
VFEQLLVINAEAFSDGDYETAYHALAAALHRATFTQNSPQLAEVEAVAADQASVIDTQHPTHNLSSQSAKTRVIKGYSRCWQSRHIPTYCC